MAFSFISFKMKIIFIVAWKYIRVGTGHGFLIESWGFQIGRDLQVNSFDVLILQMRKQRPRKTECPYLLAELGLYFGSSDSQGNAFSSLSFCG